MTFPVASNFTDFTPVFPGIPGTAPKIYTASTPSNLAAVTTADFAFNEINNGWLSAGDLVNIKYLDGLMGQTTQQFVMGNDGATLAVFGDGSGTVASVAMTGDNVIFNSAVSGSPITTTGTLTPTLKTQSANMVLAGPTTGSAAAPTMRSLVGADLPNPSTSSLGGIQAINAIASNWIRSISTSGVPALSQPNYTDLAGNPYIPVDNNGGGSVNASTINFANGTGTTASVSSLAGVSTVTINSTTSGTVTSVGMTGDNVIFESAVTGSPISTSGTLSPVLKTQSANTFLSGATSGAAATPTFRAITAADFPSGSILTLRSAILNFTTTGATLVGTTDATGRKFNVTAARYVIAAADTVTVPFQASVGITSTAYTDISGNTTLILLTAADTSTEAPLQPLQPVIATATGIFVNINTGATAVELTGYVDVQGYYE